MEYRGNDSFVVSVGSGGEWGEFVELLGAKREFYRSCQILVMICLKYLRPLGLPLFGQSIITPLDARCDRRQ